MSLCVLGSINMDIVASVRKLPLPGETVTAARLDRFPGGKGANQAIAAARLGADTTLIGAVGDDGFGRELIEYLRSSDVQVSNRAIMRGETTGQAFINVSEDGENAIVVIPGANHAFKVDMIEDIAAYQRTVFLSQLEMPVEAIHAFFATEAAKAGTTILNAAPAILDGRSLFEISNIIIVNETELAAFSESAPTTSIPLLAVQARKLITSDNQWVIVTLGAEGALLVSRSKQLEVPGLSADVVDTTGAGDCFCGALAAALADGKSIREAAEFANQAAAFAVTKKGAAPSMPSLEDLAQFKGSILA